jgi:hypothetical protein
VAFCFLRVAFYLFISFSFANAKKGVSLPPSCV